MAEPTDDKQIAQGVIDAFLVSPLDVGRDVLIEGIAQAIANAREEGYQQGYAVGLADGTKQASQGIAAVVGAVRALKGEGNG